MARIRVSSSLLLLLFVGLASAEIYTDQFVVHVQGGTRVARELAEKHGFSYLGNLFDDYHHLRHKRLAKRSLEPSLQHHKSLQQESNVHWFSQQTLKRRTKRGYRTPATPLNDARWLDMWYLNRGGGLDMNVEEVWKKNITGRGVVVTILDDGLEKDHPDLVDNYDPQASWDMNNHDSDPQPRYDMVDSNRHGTRCAGEVAAVHNNSICSVGVAYSAGIGGVRMLDGDVTDVVEARSLSLNNQHIDVYSASWGPDDDGKTVDGPGELATRAFREGIEKGRRGLGSIFVWASGNGGRDRDNCNCDGYTNSIWTLSISSATENGLVPWYSEACSSTLATTYSSGSTGERQIVTTDLHHSCTSTHTGTSASAPLAAGICALALEANRKLTWRDMQHIVVRTARPANLHASDWLTNGVNRNVSHSFGYGLMDAAAMVDLAKRWTTVPAQKTCMVKADPMDKMISPKSSVELKLEVNCLNVKFLEHVQAKVTLSATRRGDLHIYLTSPAGTRSTLLAQRALDNSRSGFQAWPFMTVHSWGESPNGIWKLQVHNDGRYFGRASLKEWSLILYGTTEDPDDFMKSPTGPKVPEESATSKEPPPVTQPQNEIAPQTTQAPTAKTTVESKTFPVYRPMKPPPSLERPPNEQEHLDNFLRPGSRRPASPPGFPVAIHGTRENSDRSPSSSSSDVQRKPMAPDSAASPCGIAAPCIECPPSQFIYFNMCVDDCPPGSYRSINDVEDDEGKKRGQPACLHCHYSCKVCKGPNDNECAECYPDAEHTGEGYCQPKNLVEKLNLEIGWYRAMTISIMTLCIIIVGAVALFFMTSTSFCNFCCSSSRHDSNGARYSGLPAQTSMFAEENGHPAGMEQYRASDVKKAKPYRDDDI
ncbi:furin-like protease 1, isoforms 1/1-X/2 isoform X2 [Ornithodoros turicata]|uniref:furin-like protease 1, isoforms 1/1-X/2 isoform X2 n=1 Tax=Ornithodoros turicata TaxID=34597 RepID=UPI003139C603